MKLSFKSSFNVLKFGGAYTAAAITCLVMSLCFYCVAYGNRNVRDITFYVCISTLSLVCCMIHISIIASLYMRKIIEDTTEKDFKKNDKTIISLHKMCRVFTLIGCMGVIAIAVYMIVHTLLGVIS